MFSHLFARDIGIDLGTANTLVFIKGQGIVLEEPSVIAMRQGSKIPIAVGLEAKQMIGRTPGDITAVCPMRDGVIADFDTTRIMLAYFIKKARKRPGPFRPRIVISVPSGVTGVERRAVQDAAIQAGAREAYLLEEPLAAAMGAGLPVGEPMGQMIVGIGGGTTEVAIISLGGLVSARSVRSAGVKMDEAILTWIKKNHSVLIGDFSAEQVKIQIGSAAPTGPEGRMDVRGRDLLTGLPRTISVTSEEIRTALSECVVTMIDAIKATLETAPPDLAADIMERGITLTGGGAQLKGLDLIIAQQTGVPVMVAEDPLRCVAMGTGKALEELHMLKRVRSPA